HNIHSFLKSFSSLFRINEANTDAFALSLLLLKWDYLRTYSNPHILQADPILHLKNLRYPNIYHTQNHRYLRYRNLKTYSLHEHHVSYQYSSDSGIHQLPAGRHK